VIEKNSSSFWAKHRSAAIALVLFALFAALIGCGGGGGGGTTGGNGGNGGTNGGPPAAPTGLVATPGNSKVTLAWNGSAGANSYTVLRSLNAINGFVQIIAGNTTTNFTDSTVTNDTTYFYKVRAVNINGTSGDSNVASATPTAATGGGPSWLPANTIFYQDADTADPTSTDIRTIKPDGSNDAVFAVMPQQVSSAAPNPNVANQILFAYTTDTTISATSVYAIYRNTSIGLAGATKLTDEGTNPFNFVGTIGFTPDGQKIFFTAQVGSDHGLYLMNPNGTNIQRIASADDASLSPDGSKLLISQDGGGQDDIFYINLNDPSFTPNAVLQTTGQDEIMPQWSKDGTKICFAAESTSSPTPNFEIYTKPFSGGSTTQVTANGDDNFSPSFSPDNSQVAYARVSNVDVSLTGLYRAPAAGGSQTVVKLDSSIGNSVYWTSSTGRSLGGGESVSISHTLHHLRIRK